MSLKIMSEIGPPMMMPTVPAATMKSAVPPSFTTLPRSTETISSRSANRSR